MNQHIRPSKPGWAAILVALLVFLMVVGLTLPTTAQTTPTPIVVNRSPSCRTLNNRDGTFPSVLSDFGFRINDVSGPFNGIYQRINSNNQNGLPTVLTGGAPSDALQTVTINNSTSKIFDWSSSFEVTAVIVKGRTNANAYVYSPSSFGSPGLTTPGGTQNISYVEFCFGSTATNTPTNTATPTDTNTPTNTPTPTDTSTPTNTPTNTATPTDTNTPTNTPTPTDTSTPTNTPTNTPTPTDTNTPTNTPTPTDTSTPTNTPPPPLICSSGAGVNELTTILGAGMGSNSAADSVVKIVVPNAADVLRIYGQLAGKEQRAYGYARFIRADGTFINDMSKESPAYRDYAVFWFGQDLTPATSPHWRARLVNAPTNAPFVQRAFILYPTYQTAQSYVNVFETFPVSSENQVFWDTANGWIPAQQQTLTMVAPLDPVSLTVSVAVVDNDRDNRPFQLTVTAGGVSQQVTLNNPTNGNELNIVQVTLDNVPAGTDEIVIDLVSPNLTGDSVAMVGATANYSCGVN